MLLRKTIIAGFLISSLGVGVANAANPLPLPAADTDGDGALTAEEYVLFEADRQFNFRDKNKDGILTKVEWLGKSKSSFPKDAWDKFNADGDETFNADELVSVYLWIFGNKDKNKDGKLSGNELPEQMRAKS